MKLLDCLLDLLIKNWLVIRTVGDILTNTEISIFDLIQDNTPAVTNQQKVQDGSQVQKSEEVEDNAMRVTVEKELVSQAEEADMEALLGTYVYFFIFYFILG